MVFQRFQEDLNNWLNQGNNKQELDNIAKEVTGIPTVKVKDPQVFTQFIQDSNPQLPQPQPEPEAPVTQEPSQFIGKGGLIDPQRVKEFGLGLAELGSYGFGQAGEQFRNIDIDGQPLYEVGQVQQPLIDPQVAMEFAARAGGPEIPEAVPFLGGMTPAEALAGGAAYLTSPLDAAITAGTVGLGPAASAGIKATRAALPATTLGKGAKALLKPAELLVEPVAKGGVGKRLAGEVALTTPTLTTLAGTEKRKEEGIAYGFENAASSIGVGLTGTVGGSALISKVNVPRIKNAFKSSDIAYASTNDESLAAKNILEDPIFKANYEQISSSQKLFIDNYIKQVTKTPITKKQKEFLYEKLLGTYNRKKLDKVSEVLNNNDPKKQEVKQVVKILEENIENKKIKKQKTLDVEYDEKVYSNNKGRLARVFESNGKVHRIFKSVTQWDPDANKQTTVLNSKQQEIIDKLIIAVKTGDTQSAAEFAARKKAQQIQGEEIYSKVYNERIDEGISPRQATVDAKKAQNEHVKKINKMNQGPKTTVTYNPNRANLPTYKTIIPKEGTPLLRQLLTGLKNTKYSVQETTFFKTEDVDELLKAIDTNVLNNLDKGKAINALIKLMGDPRYKGKYKKKTIKEGIGTSEQEILEAPRFGLEGEIPNAEEINILKKAFGNDLVNELIKLQRSGFKTTFNTPRVTIGGKTIIDSKQGNLVQILDQIWAIPRVLKATFDLSAIALQGGYFLITRPISTGKALKTGLNMAFRPMFELLLDPRALDLKLKNLYSRPNVRELVEGGMDVTDTTSARLVDREEGFLPSITEKLPTFTIYGPIVRGSNRFHSGFLSALRAEVGDSIMKQMKDNGVPMDKDLVSDIAKYVNWSTGRGPKWAPDMVVNVANRLLFSYRLQTSRIIFPFVGMIPHKALLGRGPIGNVIKKDRAKFMLFLGTILGAASLVGEKENRVKVDFLKGKIRVDEQSFDFDTGAFAYGDLAFDIIESIFPFQSKASTGIPYDKELLATLGNKTSSLLNPAVSMIKEGITGKDYFGNEINWEEYNPIAFDENILERQSRVAKKYLLPLNILETIEAYEILQSGPRAALGGAADTIGVMSSTYVNKNDIALDLFKKEYTELYPFEQKFVTTMYYSDDRVNREIPTSLKLEQDFQNEMNALLIAYTNGDKTENEVVNDYFSRRDYKFAGQDVAGRITYGWDEQDREDYDVTEYSYGNEAQKTALRQHRQIMDTDGVQLKDAKGKPTRLINWNEYDRIKTAIRANWTTEQKEFVAANSLYFEALIPRKIFDLLPPTHQQKIINSIRAREKLLNERLDVNLQKEYYEAFERLNNK